MLTIVSGFQRCGSSLMCQMLAAGGMQVFHDEGSGYPAFETRLANGRGDQSPLLTLDGWAVKWLEPMQSMPPPFPFEVRVVWMRRNVREQARSAAKFMRAVGGFEMSRTDRQAFEASYRRDEPKSRELWRARGQLLSVTFEALLECPLSEAEVVAEFLDVPLDVEKMAAEVRERPPQCLPGMLELELIAERGRRDNG